MPSPRPGKLPAPLIQLFPRCLRSRSTLGGLKAIVNDQVGAHAKLVVRRGGVFVDIPKQVSGVIIDGDYNPATGYLTCPYVDINIRDLYVV